LGRAVWAFVESLGERIANKHGMPLVGLKEAGELAITIDGANEVDPGLNLIEGSIFWWARRS